MNSPKNRHPYDVSTEGVSPDGSLQIISPQLLGRGGVLRLDEPFPAKVAGIDAANRRFKTDAVVGSLTPNFLRLSLDAAVGEGSQLLVVVRLSTIEVACAPSVAVRGTVAQIEATPDGRRWVSVIFSHHRFLYAASAS